MALLLMFANCRNGCEAPRLGIYLAGDYPCGMTGRTKEVSRGDQHRHGNIDGVDPLLIIVGGLLDRFPGAFNVLSSTFNGIAG